MDVSADSDERTTAKTKCGEGESAISINTSRLHPTQPIAVQSQPASEPRSRTSLVARCRINDNHNSESLELLECGMVEVQPTNGRRTFDLGRAQRA